MIASISEPREVLSMSRAELAVRQTALVAALLPVRRRPRASTLGTWRSRAGRCCTSELERWQWSGPCSQPQWGTIGPRPSRSGPQAVRRRGRCGTAGISPVTSLPGGSWERWVRWNSPPGRPPHATTGAQHPDDVGFPRCVEFRVGSSFSWLAEYVGWHHVTGSGPHHRTDTPRLKRLPGWGRDARGNTTPRRDPAIPCRRRNE